jgi:Fur family zinc uptake transcriptional regulator
MSNALFPSLDHNHARCLDLALRRAHAVCAKRGVRLTDLRARVFREFASSHSALGAYDIIDRLAREGRRLAPISVYRIIEVLEAAGLIHRLESRNAYFACLTEHEGETSSLVLLCESCGRVAEADASAAWSAICGITRACNFMVAGSVLELKGRCGACDDAGQHEVRP